MLDIRIPIGLLFTILGVIVTIYGFMTNSDTAMYARSLNMNINIWSGILMLIFGGIMLLLVKLNTKKKEAEK